MVDSCTITGPATSPVFNETTGLYTSTPGATIYSGKCKRQSINRFEQTANAGDHVFVESRLQLHLPVLAPLIPEGSIATITAAPHDPHSVGIKLRVSGPGGKSFPTAQRLNVTEVVG